MIIMGGYTNCIIDFTTQKVDNYVEKVKNLAVKRL